MLSEAILVIVGLIVLVGFAVWKIGAPDGCSRCGNPVPCECKGK